MATIRAIYENGVFRPVEPVNLPEHTAVEVTPAATNGASNAASTYGFRTQLPNQVDPRAVRRVWDALGESVDDPGAPTDLASRHDEPNLDDGLR
jgi:predicted DNA-binding antitoxin AbrB/MazE fold protein